MKEIVIATGNPGKVEEFREMLKDKEVELHYLAEWPDIVPPIENGSTFAANARLKASYYAKATGLICIADDSGLEVMALKGAPGVRSARYAGEKATAKECNDLLIANMKLQVHRGCRFRCALAVAAPNGSIMVETDGICDGMLLHEPLGDGGFGYDPLFWSNELHMGFGEASPEEKNKVSHRAKAIKKLLVGWRKIK